MKELEAVLAAEMNKMPVIDAHNHLPTEAQELSANADMFTRVFAHYSITNAQTTGMPLDREWLKNGNVSLEERWNVFKNFYPLIKETGYVRAARYTASILYGIDEICDDTYQELSKRIAAQNKPGLFDWVLKEKCHIRKVINQGAWRDDFAPGVCREFMGLCGRRRCELLTQTYDKMLQTGFAPKTAAEFADSWLTSVVDRGYIGVKFTADFPPCTFSRAQADKAMRELVNGRLSLQGAEGLAVWMADRIIGRCGELNLTVAIHCGLNCYAHSDFYPNNPKNMAPYILKYPETKFDLYHAAIPWVREIAVLANQSPNVYLNLVWAHQISPFMVRNVLNEWMDLVPLNKIIGFGGDNICAEKTCGALACAKENIAKVLSARAEETKMSETEAVAVCRMWLYDNAAALYN